MSGRIEIRVPDIGDFADVPVIEVLVKAGETVTAGQSLVTLESDKATMEVPSPGAGVITALSVGVGDTVSEGDLIAVLAEQEGASAAVAAAPANDTLEAAPPPLPRRPAPAPVSAEAVTPGQLPYASPVIRALARELGVDLRRVRGSGRNGRILRDDVTAFVQAAMTGTVDAPRPGLAFDLPPAPEIDFTKFGQTLRRPLSRIRKISGGNLHRNWLSIPHVTHNDRADITAMEAFRQARKSEVAQRGFRLTALVFLIKACVAAMREHPQFNASLDPDGEHLVLKKFFHIGIAVDTADGLVVPVIRDCDRKSVMQLARELSEVSARAREQRLEPRDWQGGCFTISSLGGIGGTSFNPIINAPEVAVLGVSRARTEPVWDGESFRPRLLLPLSLSYDHRVIDGAAAARFTRCLAQQLENEDLLSLE